MLRPRGRLHIADWSRPRGLAPRAGFAVLRLLDGRANTRLQATGRLPELVADAGYAPVTITGRIRLTDRGQPPGSGRAANGARDGETAASPVAGARHRRERRRALRAVAK